MRLLDSTDYKQFVRSRLEQMARKGRGQVRRMAEHLGVPSSAVSQIFRGPRDLTPDQAQKLGEFFGFSREEREYFHCLVQYQRAGSPELRDFMRAWLERIRATSGRAPAGPPGELTPAQERLFFSEWYYIAVWLLLSTPGHHTVPSIAERFELPKKLVTEVMAFLTTSGLCAESRGAYRVGPRSVRLGPDALLRSRHYVNWRIRAIDRIPRKRGGDFFYSLSVSLSRSDVLVLRKRIEELIMALNERVATTRPRELFCLNLDWFQL
jgi:uncharacterized protein (TIGR02147 family)